MPFRRFRVRTLMIAVAILPLTLTTISARREWLSRYYRDRAQQSRNWAKLAPAFVYRLTENDNRDGARARAIIEPHIVDGTKRSAEYYDALSAKYHSAAHRPWLRVPPDAPPPD